VVLRSRPSVGAGPHLPCPRAYFRRPAAPEQGCAAMCSAWSLGLVESVELGVHPSHQGGETPAIPSPCNRLRLDVRPGAAGAGGGPEEAAADAPDDEDVVLRLEGLDPCGRVPHGHGHRGVVAVAGAGGRGEGADLAPGRERTARGRPGEPAAQDADVDGFHRPPFSPGADGGSAGSRDPDERTAGVRQLRPRRVPGYPVKRGASTTATAASTGGSQLLVTVTRTGSGFGSLSTRDRRA